jgi:NAD(P)-dependent dehydrogenase (short-subunit alcohol dehydrogenase family)
MSVFAARFSWCKKHWRFCAITRRSYLNGAEGSGGRSFPTITVYAASKAAFRSFAHTWTSALQDRKIRVKVLNPCGIATAAQDLLPLGAQQIYTEDGSLRASQDGNGSRNKSSNVVPRATTPNDGHSLPVL